MQKRKCNVRLGMRLAFDKPTIIIKDDKTGYSFDTSVIEHVEYPRDLRFTTIIRFKEKLTKKLNATYEKARKDPNYSTFLKNFGKYKITHLQDKEISSENYLLEAIDQLKRDMRILRNQSNQKENINIYENPSTEPRLTHDLHPNISKYDKQKIEKHVQNYFDTRSLKRPKHSENLPNLYREMEKIEEIREIAGSESTMKSLIRDSLKNIKV